MFKRKKIVKKKEIKVKKKIVTKKVITKKFIIPNTFGIKKYLDEVSTKQIEDAVDKKAEELGWKNYDYSVATAEIIIKKGGK